MLKLTESTTKKVLHSVFIEEILFINPNDFHRVKLCQEKASNHSSRSTTALLEKMKIDTNLEHVSFQNNPAKYPDISFMDYYAFVLLKKVLSNHKLIMIDGFWKVVEKEWKLKHLEILRKALLLWKFRC